MARHAMFMFWNMNIVKVTLLYKLILDSAEFSFCCRNSHAHLKICMAR